MNAPGERPRRTIVKVCGLTRLQDAHEARKAGADWLGFIVHGDSPRRVRPEYMGSVMVTLPGMTGVAVMVGVTPDEALAMADRAHARRVQLHGVDAHATLAGGTGRRFPWEAARAIASGRPVMLAGGLDGACVAEALETVRPFGVDASSRLESEPGLKDIDRVWEFVAAVREWDARQPQRS
jgi:phosphoribosylanthranilate isomerase